MTEPESFPTTYLSEDETRRYLRMPSTLSTRAFRLRMSRAASLARYTSPMPPSPILAVTE